jgi:membrane-associated protease RseP (regulator of RpoE activity)
MFVASGVIGGAPSAVALAFFVGVSGSALSKSAILPRWTVWLSWVAAILILITAPALYGGDNASAFYTANGIVTLLALLPLYVWTLAVSIAILRKAP